jgi:hypothetical protein
MVRDSAMLSVSWWSPCACAVRLLAVQLMNVQGPMARRVADVRLGLRVLMGAHPRDPWSIDAPFDGPALAKPIRFAVLPEPPAGSTTPTVAATVRRAGALEDAGYVVEEACPQRCEDAVSRWARPIISDFASVLGALSQMMGAAAMAFLNNCVQAVPPLADAAAWSMIGRDGIARALVELHGGQAAAADPGMDAAGLQPRRPERLRSMSLCARWSRAIRKTPLTCPQNSRMVSAQRSCRSRQYDDPPRGLHYETDRHLP